MEASGDGTEYGSGVVSDATVTVPVATDCEFEGIDSYGDGWCGNLATLTLADGTVFAPNFQSIRIFYNSQI